MENEIMKLVATNGVFATLFVWLLFNTQKRNVERENKLENTIEKNQEIISNNQEIIVELTRKFDILEDIQEDVEYIKNK